MPSPVQKPSAKDASNVWKEAYDELNRDGEGRKLLKQLKSLLKKEMRRPSLELRSEAGYEELQKLINERSESLLKSRRSSAKVGRICDTMIRLQDLFAIGANVGGPYVALPTAALFLAFSFNQIYNDSKEKMFRLATRVADYTLIHATCSDSIEILSSDDTRIRVLRQNLHTMYISLYKAIILASARLTICLYSGGPRLFQAIFGHDNWEDHMKDLDEQENRCERVRLEMHKHWSTPGLVQPARPKPMGPGTRNPLHWAAALGARARVLHLIQTEEYPINALTPKSWTAVHLTARQGSTDIMKTLLTATGLNLRIKNEGGQTALHIAALHDRVGIVSLLLQRDPGLLNRWDSCGRTASTIAAANGHIDVLKVLKEHGQNFDDVASEHGFTALHLAAGYGRLKTVEFLLANGAKRDIRLKAGKHAGLTAKQVAEQSRHFKVAALL